MFGRVVARRGPSAPPWPWQGGPIFLFSPVALASAIIIDTYCLESISFTSFSHFKIVSITATTYPQALESAKLPLKQLVYVSTHKTGGDLEVS